MFFVRININSLHTIAYFRSLLLLPIRVYRKPAADKSRESSRVIGKLNSALLCSTPRVLRTAAATEGYSRAKVINSNIYALFITHFFAHFIIFRWRQRRRRRSTAAKK